jgi:hypothetical protein
LKIALRYDKPDLRHDQLAGGFQNHQNTVILNWLYRFLAQQHRQKIVDDLEKQMVAEGPAAGACVSASNVIPTLKRNLKGAATRK